MACYLVQIDPAKAEPVKSSLSGIGIRPLKQIFDYIYVDIPPELVPKVKSVSGVIDVRPETKVEIKQVIIPVERKLAAFQRLFWSNPITGPASAIRFSLAAAAQKDRWSTSESRKMVGADVAEAEGLTGKGVKVAVTDTGFDHLNLQMPFKNGTSAVEGMPVSEDENGHGTHVATTIAGKAIATPWGGIKGVAPDVEIGIFKCLGYFLGVGTESSVLRAMMDAFQWGADIISMSLGSPYTEEDPENIPSCRVVKMLTQQGVIVVIANGNDGPNPKTVGVAANSPYALSVGAVDRAGTIASFSSRGPTAQGIIKPDVCAPGVDILSSTCGAIAIMEFMDGPKLGAISGTSMATPHASATVALGVQYARSKGKKLTTEGIKEAMSLYGDYPGEEKDNDYGYGLITWQILKRYIDEKLA